MSEWFERKESGLAFKFAKARVWDCENSPLFRNLSGRPKLAEFAVLEEVDDTVRLCIIEAKSSAPRVLSEFCSQVAAKLCNALILFATLRLGFHGDAESELPEKIANAKIEPVNVHLVLIISAEDFKDANSPNLQDALVKELRAFLHLTAIKTHQVHVYSRRHKHVLRWLGLNATN